MDGHEVTVLPGEGQEMFTARKTRSDDPGGSGARLEYELARLPRELMTAITWHMSERGVTKRELAQRLGVTPGRVSQVLSGDENLTLRTLAAVCAALDAHLQVELIENKPEDAATWLDSKAEPQTVH